MSKFNPETVEALSRAVCEAWGWDPDKQAVTEGGIVGKTWQVARVQDHVLAFLAMRRVGATLPKKWETNRG